jgi:hypothetical protein
MIDINNAGMKDSAKDITLFNKYLLLFCENIPSASGNNSIRYGT